MFMLKADIGLSDDQIIEFLRHKAAQLEKQQPWVFVISEQVFGKAPPKVEILANQGTFHGLFQVSYPHAKYIVKTRLELNELPFNGFEKENQLNQRLHQSGLETVQIYAADAGYLIMDYVDGVPLKQIAGSQPGILEQLGTQLKKIHSIQTQGYGIIANNSGNASSWRDYFFTNLAEHLQICLSQNYLTKSQYTNSRLVFQNFEEYLDLTKPFLLHGDLSDQNVFFCESQHLKIIDWEDALSGDPIFDIALWGTFIGNHDKLATLLNGYFVGQPLPKNFYLKYWCYYYRILLAKTVHRYRFGYALQDNIPARDRLAFPLEKIQPFLFQKAI